MDYIAAIEFALKNEKTEMNFYQNEANRSSNQLAQKMFSRLAKDEEEHMNQIRELHQKLIDSGQWPQNVPIQVKDTNISQVFDKIVAEKGSTTQHDNDDVAALEKAVEFETKGSRFYSEISQKCDNPMEKNFFEFLSKIEKKHQLSLEDSLAYLKDPEDWMMQHERAGLDGA
jgi:rubrerythrin